MEETSTNVILFPREKRNSPLQSMEEITQRIKDNKEFFVDQLTMMLFDYVLQEVIVNGYRLDDEDQELVAIVNLIPESIKALLFKLNGETSYLHEVAVDLYLEEDDDDAQAVLVVTEKIDSGLKID